MQMVSRLLSLKFMNLSFSALCVSGSSYVLLTFTQKINRITNIPRNIFRVCDKEIIFWCLQKRRSGGTTISSARLIKNLSMGGYTFQSFSTIVTSHYHPMFNHNDLSFWSFIGSLWLHNIQLIIINEWSFWSILGSSWQLNSIIINNQPVVEKEWSNSSRNAKKIFNF